jgi:hypothetical protein
MFLTELTPIFQDFTKQPLAFLGGLVSGALRLNLADEPVKTWLDKQAGSPYTSASTDSSNGQIDRPQSISID